MKNENKTIRNTVDRSIEEYIKLQFDNKNLEKVISNKDISRTYDETKALWTANNKIVDLYSKNADNDRKLKEKYGILFIVVLFIQIFFVYLIFIFVGCGKLKYSNTTLNIFISGGLVETFAIIKIIIKYLFTDNLSNPLKIILENNNKSIKKK